MLAHISHLTSECSKSYKNLLHSHTLVAQHADNVILEGARITTSKSPSNFPISFIAESTTAMNENIGSLKMTV